MHEPESILQAVEPLAGFSLASHCKRLKIPSANRSERHHLNYAELDPPCRSRRNRLVPQHWSNTAWPSHFGKKFWLAACYLGSELSKGHGQGSSAPHKLPCVRQSTF